MLHVVHVHVAVCVVCRNKKSMSGVHNNVNVSGPCSFDTMHAYAEICINSVLGVAHIIVCAVLLILCYFI